MTEYESRLRWREIVKRCVLLGCAKLDLWFKACDEVRTYEMRYNHNHDEKGRFCSGDGVDKSGEKVLDNFAAGDIIETDARNDFSTIDTKAAMPIQHGFSAFPKSDALSKNVQKVKPEPGYYDVSLHGSPTAVAFGTTNANMSPRLLANVIRKRGDYNGESIRLLSCSTGKSAGGSYCFAEELSNALGVTVKAPNDKLYISSNGNLQVGENSFGKFIEFEPNQRRRLK